MSSRKRAHIHIILWIVATRCYSCESKENECSESEYGSKINCPASKGCRIAKKNDLEDPQWERGCAIEDDFFCDTFDNPDGEEGVSWG